MGGGGGVGTVQKGRRESVKSQGNVIKSVLWLPRIRTLNPELDLTDVENI